MDDLSLSHSKYNCTYHIVFIPKYRKKAMFGNLRKEIGEIIGKVCKMEDVTIIKAATLPCAYVCFHSAQSKCFKGDREDQGEECTDDI